MESRVVLPRAQLELSVAFAAKPLLDVRHDSVGAPALEIGVVMQGLDSR